MTGNFLAVKSYLNSDEIKKRFQDLLGEKAGQFTSSLLSVVNGNTNLSKATPESIMASALIGASLDLPIDPNLGFSAIVPYNDKAQFQIMYKGLIQLAIRSGQYAKMNVSEVYEDELKNYDPITGEVEFNDFKECKMRDAGQEDKIIGVFAWFKLSSGFEKPLYMSKSQIEAHAKKYSKAYGYDINYKKKSSLWSTDWTTMAKKTVLKLLLSKWGILSVQLQKAILEDQKVEDEYADNANKPSKKEALVPTSSLDKTFTQEYPAEDFIDVDFEEIQQEINKEQSNK